MTGLGSFCPGRFTGGGRGRSEGAGDVDSGVRVSGLVVDESVVASNSSTI